jgi:hypothetical protein
LVWCRSMRAQPEHMHMWRQGSAVVSRGALMQMTHSLPWMGVRAGVRTVWVVRMVRIRGSGFDRGLDGGIAVDSEGWHRKR